MYKPIHSKTFKKDYKRLLKSGRFDVKKLEKTIEMLCKNERLPQQYNDHPLKGRIDGFRECHIAPDLLLIYRIIEDVLILNLLRLGSHSELFK